MRAVAEGGAATNGVADTTMIQVQIMGELISAGSLDIE